MDWIQEFFQNIIYYWQIIQVIIPLEVRIIVETILVILIALAIKRGILA